MATAKKSVDAIVDQTEEIRKANRTAVWAIWISFGALLVSGLSVFYSHWLVEYTRQQVDLTKQQNSFIRRQVEFQEKVTLSAKIDVARSATPEVRLVIENNGGRGAIIEDIFVDKIHITEHPLFEKRQFDFDREELKHETVKSWQTNTGKMKQIILQPGSSVTYLTIATVPNAQTSSQSISHPTISVSVQYNYGQSFIMTGGFSMKLIFPRSYLQWRDSRSKATEASPPKTTQQ